MGNIIRRTDIPEGDGNASRISEPAGWRQLEEPISPKGTETLFKITHNNRFNIRRTDIPEGDGNIPIPCIILSV